MSSPPPMHRHSRPLPRTITPPHPRTVTPTPPHTHAPSPPWMHPGTGKTKLLHQLRSDIEDMAQLTATAAAAAGGKPSFHVFHSTAGIAHRSEALYPWRGILRTMFAIDR